MRSVENILDKLNKNIADEIKLAINLDLIRKFSFFNNFSQ